MRAENAAKTSFDHIYTEPDPRAFFSALRELDYCIPQLAKPHFTKFVEEYRAAHHVDEPTVLDIGCSYGVNAALLRCDASMDELYELYSESPLGRDELIARDRDLLRRRFGLAKTRFIGFDRSRPALAYALEAGFIDDALEADLEHNEPTERQREQLATADIVVSTGCIGYVTEATISRVAAAHGSRRPWMAHFVLRMFSYEPIAHALAELGYETVPVEGVFKQRRFSSAEEQSQVIGTLTAAGVDPRGLEDDGWLYAQLYLSRPRTT
ncbi:class I SAM-dependent methyltransferase [Amycolatopsis sp. cg5]|uniref:class I SAM-dependent methyltransferase n=1 Tax=Amycolatopsis sp. cg5 TaxID=3238802 RepID=UPI003525E438